MGFGEAAFKFWEEIRDRECAELQEAEGTELHGSSTRTVRVRRVCSSFCTRGSSTDRAAVEVALQGSLHGPCPLFGVARVINTGRVPEACALIFGVARGVLSSIRTVLRELHGSRFRFARGVSSGSSVCTGRAIWHGSHSFLHGSSLFLHGACDFPSSEVGSPNFSQYSELVMIWY